MYSIGELCKQFKLSRSTLLYYDSIHLLKASGRTESNYRVYSEEDRLRLEKICLYREAGVALDDMEELLNPSENGKENLWVKQLVKLNEEMHLLRLRQKTVLEFLRSKNDNKKEFILDKYNFTSILKSSGVGDTALDNLHIELERKAPEEHQSFLEFLGIEEEEIKEIRDKARTEIDT